MSDYIDREETGHRINAIRCTKQTTWYEFYQKVLRTLTDMPSADVEPVRHGKWEQVDEQPYFRKHFHRMCCSVCRHEGYKSYPYCPYCGAQMTEDNENE